MMRGETESREGLKCYLQLWTMSILENKLLWDHKLSGGNVHNMENVDTAQQALLK